MWISRPDFVCFVCEFSGLQAKITPSSDWQGRILIFLIFKSKRRIKTSNPSKCDCFVPWKTRTFWGVVLSWNFMRLEVPLSVSVASLEERLQAVLVGWLFNSKWLSFWRTFEVSHKRHICYLLIKLNICSFKFIHFNCSPTFLLFETNGTCRRNTASN